LTPALRIKQLRGALNPKPYTPVRPSAGRVTLKRKEIAQLIGKVFIQKAAVNLLSTVLDTPEFFWSAPDSMQVRLLQLFCARDLSQTLVRQTKRAGRLRSGFCFLTSCCA